MATTTVEPNAQPVPEPTPTPAPEPVAPAATPAAPASASPERDVDDILLDGFRAAEAAGTTPDELVAPTPVAPAAPAAATPEAAPAAAAAEPPASQPMIPKARLDDEIGKRTNAETAAAYWRGIAEGRATVASTAPAAPAAPAVAQKSPREQVAEIDAQVIALADKFDKGEIGMADYKKDELRLNGQRQDILDAAKKPAPTPAIDPVNSDLYLKQLTAKIENEHPYAWLIEADTQWNFIEAEARTSLLNEGVPLTNDAGSALALRTRMAELADRYGPTFTGIAPADAPARASAKSGRQLVKPSAPATPRSPNMPTPEQRASKLELATRHAPDINAAGSGGGGAATYTDDQIAGMTDDQVDALPDAVKRRLVPLPS